MAVTIKEIAKRAGVSYATVSDVLNNKWQEKRISQKTRDKILKLAKKMRYRRNIVASSLVKQQTRVLGLLIPCVTFSFFPDVARGVENAAREHGYNVLLCHSDGNVKQEREEIELLREHQVAGLIINPAYDRGKEDKDIFLQLKKDRIPFVFFNRYIEGLDCNFVVTDDRAGAYEAVTHLIKLKHRRIAHISGPKNASTAKERLQGYRKALIDNGIVPDPDLVIGDGWSEEDGYKAMKKWLELAPEKRPTAVFAVTDLTAFSALQAIKEKGLRVPEDIAIVGYSDIKAASMGTVPLTTVRQPAREMGVRATRILLEEIAAQRGGMEANSKKVVFETELILRESCGVNRKGVENGF